MLVELTDFFTTEGKTAELETELEMDKVSNSLGEFPVVSKTSVKLQLVNTGRDKVLVRGRASLVLELSCDRCLKPVKVPFDLEPEREIEGGETDPETADEENYMEGSQLNVDALFADELMMNWPMKVLCRPDCRGLCPQCGKDLNTGDCDCDTFVPDPRMAGIKELLNADDKEV